MYHVESDRRELEGARYLFMHVAALDFGHYVQHAGWSLDRADHDLIRFLAAIACRLFTRSFCSHGPFGILPVISDLQTIGPHVVIRRFGLVRQEPCLWNASWLPCAYLPFHPLCMLGSIPVMLLASFFKELHQQLGTATSCISFVAIICAVVGPIMNNSTADINRGGDPPSRFDHELDLIRLFWAVVLHFVGQ